MTWFLLKGGGSGSGVAGDGKGGGAAVRLVVEMDGTVGLEEEDLRRGRGGLLVLVLVIGMKGVGFGWGVKADGGCEGWGAAGGGAGLGKILNNDEFLTGDRDDSTFCSGTFGVDVEPKGDDVGPEVDVWPNPEKGEGCGTGVDCGC